MKQNTGSLPVVTGSRETVEEKIMRELLKKKKTFRILSKAD